MLKIISYILSCKIKFIYRLWRKINRESNPRQWSNDELKKIAHLFCGDIINVSAGADRDKENNHYCKYFSSAKSYVISNYQKEHVESEQFTEIELDLNMDLALKPNLISRFDVVFSHTVLEHVYDIKTAVSNLCKMSKDIVITVVPFMQPFHHREENYHDYWRLSPYAIVNLFNEHDFKTVYINWNNDPIGNIYIFHVASKCPERWDEIVKQRDLDLLGYGPGYYRQLLLGSANDCSDGKIANLRELA